MPFQRQTLSQILAQVAADIASAIPGADALLRFADLTIIGKVLGTLTNLHYGYQDYIAKNAVPFTATGEFLEGWAALKGVIRKAASTAGVPNPGAVTFINCTPGYEITGDVPLVRGDGVEFITTDGATVDGGGTVVVPVACTVTGAVGDTDNGIIMTLGIAIPGIQSTGTVSSPIEGGADTEDDDDLRNRMLAAYQNPPGGGSAGDYINWALAVAGVTRAWCLPNGQGSGTSVVYFMCDETESAFGGFPQGTNGCATAETRAAAATGDQLNVANYIYPLQPVTALVYACAPTNNAVPFTISGLSGAGATVQANVEAALTDVFRRLGSPGGVYLPSGETAGTIDLSDCESAIASVAGTEGFIITSPSTNITSASGALPTLGAVTFS